MADKQARVLVTCNAGDAKKVLQEFDRLIEQHAAHIQKLVAEGQANSAACKQEERILKALSQVQRDNIEDTKRLSAVIDDLANTKLRDLRRALGSGKSMLQGLTGSPEDIARAEKIREQMREVGNQLKLLEGQYVKLEEGMKDLDHQSDQWLDKAIKQQQELLSVTRRGTAEYDKMKKTLGTLTNERDLRSMRDARTKRDAEKSWAQNDANNRMGSLTGQSEAQLKEMLNTFEQMKSEMQPYSQEWLDVAKNIETVNARMKEVQANTPYAHNYDNAKDIAHNESLFFSDGTTHEITKKDLEWSKNYLQNELNNTPLTDTAKIKEIQDALGAIDNRMKALNGDTQKASMSADELNNVLGNMKTASLNDLKAASKELNKQLGEMAPSSDAAKQVKKQLAELDKEIKQVEEDMVDVNDVIARSKNGKASIDELKKAYKQLGDEMNQLETGGKEFKEKQKALDQLKQKIDSVTGATNKHASSWQTAMKNLTAYVGLFTVFDQLKEKMTEIVTLNLKLSDSLADIRKVSGWTMGDVSELSKRLASIDTRNSVEQLNALAYEGAKLGIGKYGVDGLTRFAEATAQIRMALHEDMGDEAIASLAKMAEVMHDMESMGVSQSLLASGSAIFKLSATTTATGTNIMEFSKRLLGLGRTADLTTPQILALGSAADTMALMPEVASTAFNKFITTLQSKYGQVAKAVGMNQERLKSLIDQHQTMQAIVEVLEHMRDMGGLNALAPIMGDLGSKGARLTNVFASMATNVNMLKDQLATAETEFEKATAITAEFDIQNETAQAMIERANNIWEKTFMTSDNASGAVKELAVAWYDVTKAITESTSFFVEAKVLLASLFYGLNVLIKAIPGLISALLYLGAIKLTNLALIPTIFNAILAGATRAGTAMVNFVGIQTASQKAAIASAATAQAEAEALYVQAVSAQQAALSQQVLAVTEEEKIAADAALTAANAELTTAQQTLAASTVNYATVTNTSTAAVIANSEAKIVNAANSANVYSAELLVASSAGTATALEEAEAVALAENTAAKEANAAASKNLRMIWGGVIFVAAIAVIDKMCERMKALNHEEERNKEVTDKIANGLVTANKEYNDACRNLKVLYGELERNWDQMEERKRLMGEINSRYGEYIGNITDEVQSVSDLKGSYQDATDALREYYYYKQKEALKADLVTDERHKGDVSFMKMQNIGGKYESNINLDIAKSAVKSYAKSGASSSEIADKLWKDFFGGDAPSNYYMDLSKLPLVGGFFPKDTFRSDDQEAMSYLHDFVKSYVLAQNNEATINKNFPGEWTPPERKKKETHDNGGGKAEKPEDDARSNISEFITKIKNFYTRQTTALMGKLTEQGMPKELQGYALQKIEEQKEQALAAAQQSIVLGSQSWNAYRGKLDKQRIEKDDQYGQSQSRTLESELLGVDVAKLRADLLRQMPKIKKGKIVGMRSDESDRAYMDRMWLSASGDEKKEASIAQKRMEARRKELTEHDYTKVVQDNSVMGLVKTGFVDIDLNNVQSDMDAVTKVLEKSRNSLAALFATDGDKGKLLTFLFGRGDLPSQFAPLANMTEEEVKLFYAKLIQYSDQYTEAEKKTYDQAKKIAEQMWAVNQRNMKSQRELADFQKDASLYGARTNFLSNLGLADNTVDPEVETMRLKMQMAEDYYYFVLQNSKNEQLIADAEKSRQDAELAYASQMATAMKSRLSQMQTLVNPIVDFGEAMGEAFAKMGEDAESANEAVKSAIKSMLQSWGKMLVNDVNTQMWKAINDAGVKRGKKNAKQGINDAQNAGEAGATADAAARAAKVLGDSESNPVYVHVVNGQSVDANGNPVTNGTRTSGIAPTANQSAGGAANGQTAAPSASQGTGVAAPGVSQAPGVAAGKHVAGSVGTATANAISGGGSMAGIGASAASAAGNALMNTEFIGGSGKKSGKSDSEEKKANKKEIKEAKKQQKELNDIAEKGTQKRTDINQGGIEDVVDATKQGGDTQSELTQTAQEAITAGVVAGGAATLAATQANETAETAVQATGTTARTSLSLVGAVAKCFEFLGPIAGPIAAATVTSILMGLLSWGLSAAFGSSDSSSSTSTPNTKLKTGMLTYDSGNVQDLKPFVADNGELYWAKEDAAPKSGVNLLTTPTATTINGQQSLVAENGPELVIGRETTKAMMMNNPSLLKALVNYDSNYSGRRAYDQGNIAETIGTAMQTMQTDNQSGATNQALTAAITALMAKLSEPITAQINMYGRGGLYENQQKATQFMKGKR